MNAETIIQEIELATWAMAEAESLEKRAHKLRVDATRTLAKVRLEMVDALEEVMQKRKTQQNVKGHAPLTGSAAGEHGKETKS